MMVQKSALKVMRMLSRVKSQQLNYFRFVPSSTKRHVLTIPPYKYDVAGPIPVISIQF